MEPYLLATKNNLHIRIIFDRLLPMTENAKHPNNKTLIDAMFKAGSHFAYARSRRHPSAKPFIFGTKNQVEIFDLEKTAPALESAKDFIKNIVANGGQVLFLGGKSESRDIVQSAALSVEMPHVAGRWIGGTFSNFGEIRKRVEKLATLNTKKQKGELAKYTKKERVLIDREIANLERFFGGLALMTQLPKVLFLIDHKREAIAVEEAATVGIPVVSLSGSDCNMKLATHAIPGNDTSVSSIKFVVGEITSAIKEGKALYAKKLASTPAPVPAQPHLA